MYFSFYTDLSLWTSNCDTNLIRKKRTVRIVVRQTHKNNKKEYAKSKWTWKMVENNAE